MSTCIAHLRCPICAAELAEQPGALRCLRGHAFNRAREGYIDLLPEGHGRSGAHGDTRAMLQARRRVLHRGCLEPLAAALASAATDGAARRAGNALAVVDAGCGEGYYLRRVSAALAHEDGLCAYGFDISREALRLAARAHPGGCYFVNDVRHGISLADATADLLLNVFAPRNAAEFARVLRPDGELLVVIPSAAHLSELRAVVPLLQIDEDKEAQVLRQLAVFFSLQQRHAVHYPLEAQPDDVIDLIRMSPNAWHLEPSVLERALLPAPMQVTIAVDLLRLRRSPR